MKPKRGRPPLESGAVRNRYIKVYVNDRQLSELALAAKENEQTLSTFVLNCALQVTSKLSSGDVLKYHKKQIKDDFVVKSRRLENEIGFDDKGMEDHTAG